MESFNADVVGEFVSHICENGIVPFDSSGIVADDQVNRFRCSNERAGKESGAYQLAVNADGFAYGWAKDWRDDRTVTWHSKGGRVLSDAELVESRQRFTRMKRRVAARQREENVKAAARAEVILKSSKSGESAYLESKGLAPAGPVNVWTDESGEDFLLVPVHGPGGSLQTLQLISEKKPWSKKFLYGGKVKGGACRLPGADSGTEPGKVLALCEGFATGWRIRQLKGWHVHCCLNAGNLVAVAKVLAKMTTMQWERVVVCADNDHGNAVNVGHQKGGQAGEILDCPVLSPPSEEGVTDWDDYAARHGDDAARELLDLDHPGAAAVVLPSVEAAFNAERAVDLGRLVRPLGHEKPDRYYFLPETKGYVVCYSVTQLNRPTVLCSLAPLEAWRKVFTGSISQMSVAAAAWLIDASHRSGVYSVDSARSVGLWEDDVDWNSEGPVPAVCQSTVLHCGDFCVVTKRDSTESIKATPASIYGKSNYESESSIAEIDHLSRGNPDLRTDRLGLFSEACRLLPFSDERCGRLMGGWIVAAVLGGALKWRPHVEISGPPKSGKSTLVNELVRPALGSLALAGDGGSTEPGLRRALTNSSRPCVIDEFESETEADRRKCELIIKLMRGASSGTVIRHADSSFVIRSCFLISGINPPVITGMDRERITTLGLQVSEDHASFSEFRMLLKSCFDPAASSSRFIPFPSMLLAEVARSSFELLTAIANLRSCLVDALSDVREADQLAPMIAGWKWLCNCGDLSNWSVADMQSEAGSWIGVSGDESLPEGVRCLQRILSYRVLVPGHQLPDIRLAECVALSADWEGKFGHPGSVLEEERVADLAVRASRSYGLKVEAGWLYVSNTAEDLARILKGSPWESGWMRVLKNLPGAESAGGTVAFAPGLKTWAVKIPLKTVL